MYKMNVIDTNGMTHTIDLTLKELAKLQTTESKRAFALGIGASAASVASIVCPRGAIKTALLAIGLCGTLATVVANDIATSKVSSDANVKKINTTLREICKDHGIDIGA